MLIKNLIFDLGGVILNIDYAGPSKVLTSMGINNFDEYYSKAKQDNIFNNFEKGLISANDFRESIKRFLKINITDWQLDTIWNAIILNFPQEHINLLIKLRKQYKIYLLSNTNIIHYNFYTKQLETANGVSWHDLFDETFFSHEMCLRKPELDIYLKTLESTGILAKETLFIDDLKVNIESASACGIKTLWFKEGMKLTDIFFIENNGLYIREEFVF